MGGRSKSGKMTHSHNVSINPLVLLQFGQLSRFLGHGTVSAVAGRKLNVLLLIQDEGHGEGLDMTSFRNHRGLAALLTIFLLMGSFGSFNVNAQRRSRSHYHRVHHSRAKGALIGAAAGVLGGALIGGKKGALIGGTAGAGTGYLIQRHRNNRHRHYRR